MANGKAFAMCLIALIFISGAMSLGEVGSESTPPYTTPTTKDKPQAEVPMEVVQDTEEDMTKKDKNVIIMDEYVQCVVFDQHETQTNQKVDENNSKRTLAEMDNYQTAILFVILLIIIAEMLLLIRIHNM